MLKDQNADYIPSEQEKQASIVLSGLMSTLEYICWKQ